MRHPPSFVAHPAMRTAQQHKSKTTPRPSRPKSGVEPRLSRTRRPEALSVAEWQAALRRQFGREQPFSLRNLGAEPVFATFRVDNLDSGTHYIVTIRGLAPGHNQCTCWDYATNHLGTCKHIEFTLARLQARRGGKAALARGDAAVHSEIRLDYMGARQLRLHPGTACPPKLLAQARRSFDQAAGWALPWSRLDDVGLLVRAAQAAGHELRVGDDVWAFIAQVRDAERRQHTLARAYPRGSQDKALHELLKTRLYPYQAEGALFAARAGRALLGDEMDLGKTVQAIAAAELMARHFGVQRVLVVCPTSLKHQWKAEFARFADRCAGHSRASCTAPGPVRAGHLLPHRQLRDAGARCRPHRGLVTRARHRRRGAAHQELEHGGGARTQAHRQSVRAGAHRHAARKPARRADLHRAVRRPAPAGSHLAAPGRASAPR